MRAFTTNIAVNTSLKPIRRSGPIYANGPFTYIPIPFAGSDITYADIGLKSAFKRMGISDYLDHGVHYDPEFAGYTFGTYPNEKPSVANLKQISRGDLLVFFGSLERTKHEKYGDSFESWIADSRGMYLFGFFEVIGILTKNGELLKPSLGKSAYSTNAHFGYYELNSKNNSWIFKGSKNSCLLPVAIPIKRRDFHQLFDMKLPRKTHQSETAQVSSYMRSAREVENVPYLIEMISDYRPSKWLNL